MTWQDARLYTVGPVTGGMERPALGKIPRILHQPAVVEHQPATGVSGDVLVVGH